MSNLRDFLILLIPYFVGMALALAVNYVIPGELTNLRTYIAIGIGGVLGPILTWAFPPFRAIEMRRIRAFLAKHRKTP